MDSHENFQDGPLLSGSQRVRRHNRKQPLPYNGDDGILSQEKTERKEALSVTQVRQAMIAAGINCKAYSGHSFRIGAATTARRGVQQLSKLWEDGRALHTCYTYAYASQGKN